MSCVLEATSLLIFAIFSEFDSSRAASISSRTKNGGGLFDIIAKRIATDVSALSPPERTSKLLIFFPGGEALISTPAIFCFSSLSTSVFSRLFSSSLFSSFFKSEYFTDKFAFPPPKIILKYLLNSSPIFLNEDLKRTSIFSSNSSITFFNDSEAFSRSFDCIDKKSNLFFVSSYSSIINGSIPPI